MIIVINNINNNNVSKTNEGSPIDYCHLPLQRDFCELSWYYYLFNTFHAMSYTPHAEFFV